MLDGTPAAPDDSFVVPDSGSSGGEGLTVIEGTPPADLDCPEDQCTVRMAGPGTPNTLVERCNATAGFTDLVEETRLRLHAELYESGTAADVLAQRVGVLTDQALDVVDEDTIASESDILAQFFTQEP
jgi:spore coat protein CotH